MVMQACILGRYIWLFEGIITSQQSFCTNMFVLKSKKDAFKQKLALWDSLVKKEDTIMFPILNEHLKSYANNKNLQSIASQHLQKLADNFDHNFPEHKYP